MMLAPAEMYVLGVATRKVAVLVEKILGVKIPSTAVSQVAQALDETLQGWRERSLSAQATPYLYLDAHYEHVRVSGQVRDVAVL